MLQKDAELERQSQLKAEFISIVAHELRTPLVSIVGYLDLMNEGRFGDLVTEMERPVASIRRNAHRLKRLVDEISARPAAARAIALKDKFTFKTEMDDEARHIMFGHLKTKVA